MQSPRLTRTASFPFLKRAAKIYPESPLQTFPKNTDEERQITAVAKIKPTAQSSIDATLLRGIKIHDDAASPVTIAQSLSHGANLSDMAPTENGDVARQSPTLVDSPLAERNLAITESQSALPNGISEIDSDDDIPPPLEDFPLTEMDLDIADKKQRISSFFHQAQIFSLRDVATMDALFSKECEVDTLEADSPAEAIRIGIELSEYFQKEYTVAIKASINALWKQRSDTVPDSAQSQYLKNILATHIETFSIDRPWHALWIHAVFTEIKQNEALPEETKKAIHARLLKETKLGLLTIMSDTDTPHGESLLLPQNKPELIQILRDRVFNGFTHPEDTTDSVQDLREQLIYHFFEGLFNVSQAELFHFDNFEYNGDEPKTEPKDG